MYGDLFYICEALLSGKEIGMKRNVKPRDGWLAVYEQYIEDSK